MSFSDGKIIGEVTPSEKGHFAFFGEDDEIDGLRYHLLTQVRMTKARHARDLRIYRA